MPTPLRITNKLPVTPLLDICNDNFAMCYSNGLRWLLYGGYKGDKPVPDSYLVENLKRDAAKGFLDGQHDAYLPSLGFYFGMIHGGILSPETGQLHPHVTTLVKFTQQVAMQGYTVGRRDCLYYPQPDAHFDTETALLAELCAIARDLRDYPDDGTNWYYSVGCILGNLSAALFPATAQEWQQWEAEYRMWQARIISQECETEPLEPVPAIEYIV